MVPARQRGSVTLIVLGVVVALALAGGFAYLIYRPAPAPAVDEAVKAPPAPAIAKVAKVVTLVPKGVQTYKPEAKARLKLPPAIVQDATQHVVAATTVADTGRPQTVTAVLNADTGQVETYVKQEPLPWISFHQRGQARVAMGYKFDPRTRVPQRVGRLSLEHDFMQVKALSAGVVASIDTDGAAFVGVGVAYRW